MSSLTGNLISDSYQGMLKTFYNTPFSESVVRITDGLGNSSALGLSTGSAIVYGNAQISGSLEILSQDIANNSLYTEGGIIAGRSGYYNSGSGGYTQLIHTDTTSGGLTIVRPTTTDNVYRNFNTNAFYITTNAPINSGSIYIQPSGLDKLVIRASAAVSGSRAVPVQVTGSIDTTGTVKTTGLDLTGSVAIQGTGSIKLAGQLSFNNGQGALVLPANTAPVPVVGSTYYNGSTLYVYNGSGYTEIGGDTVVSASYASTATSASYAISASRANTAFLASTATTASYALSSGNSFPYTGSAIISGSLNVTGSLSTNKNITMNYLTIGEGKTSNLGTVAFGVDALASNGASGYSNVAIGSAALSSSVGGLNNTAVGASTLTYNTNGSFNTAIGSAALEYNTTGQLNVAIGDAALQNNVSGSANTAVGPGALNDLLGSTSSDTQNSAFGSNALSGLTTGQFNTAVGFNAGGHITSGNYNTILGFWSGSSTTTNNNAVIAFGDNQVAYQYDGSHYLMPQGLSNYANDVAAAAGGIPVNGMYRSGSVVMIRVS